MVYVYICQYSQLLIHLSFLFVEREEKDKLIAENIKCVDDHNAVVKHVIRSAKVVEH